MALELLKKIEKQSLVGRGGAEFPVHLKWKTVLASKSKEKYLIINGAEGEPGVYKDGYILKKFLKELCLGIQITAEAIGAQKVYFYLKSSYYLEHHKRIKAQFKKIGFKKDLEFVKKPAKTPYLGGEETVVMNIIEGRRPEPRLRPPFPTVQGLFSKPTLIHNIETLYDIYLVSQNQFSGKRFYSINTPSKNKGVYHLKANLTIEEVLRLSKNYPLSKFFVQAGGDASGLVLNQGQLKRRVGGSASITIHYFRNHQAEKLINYWLDFFVNNSCGQCVPGREGTYRLKELFSKYFLNKNKLDFSVIMKDLQDFSDLNQNLRESSFCALCAEAPIAIFSYFKNVYPILKK